MAPEDDHDDDQLPEPGAGAQDQAGSSGVDELLDVIEQAIATGQPIDVVGLASSTIAIVLFPERDDEPERAPLRGKVLEQVILRYVEIGSPEALIYATALTALLPDESLRNALRPALDGAEAALPEWLARLDDAELERPTIVRDLFDDDEWLLAGVRFADGTRLSFRVEIDHDVDSAATDATLMPTDVDEVCRRLRQGGSEEALSIVDIDATDLWARYTEAVALADALDDDVRSETWPGCRPAIEWALRLGPTGLDT